MTKHLKLYNNLNKTHIIKQLTILFVLILISIILYSLNINQLEFLFKIYNSPSPDAIYCLLNNFYSWLQTMKDTLTIIPTAYAEELESYKVDLINVYVEDLQHIKLDSLCKYDRWNTIKTAIIGDEQHRLMFDYFDDCSLSDILFSVNGDLYNREFALKSYWPNNGHTLAFKVEEGLTTRRLFGLSLQQEFDYIINKNKSLPATPNELPGIQPRALLSTIFEEAEAHQTSTPPEYEEAVRPSTLPNYDTNDRNTNRLPNYNASINDIIVADDIIDPTEDILATTVEGNLPTRLANRLEFQTNWMRFRQPNSSVSRTVPVSDID